MKIKFRKPVFFLSALLLFFVCCRSPVKTNVLQSSFNIKQSKEHGVFITEYEASIKELNFKNQSFYIQQVWIENLWHYINQRGETEKRKAQRGYIKLENDSNIFKLHFIRDNLINGGITGRKLFFNISEIKDTLSFKFYLDNDTIPVEMYRSTASY